MIKSFNSNDLDKVKLYQGLQQLDELSEQIKLLRQELVRAMGDPPPINDVERVVLQQLIDIRVPCHLSGFNYLKEALTFCIVKKNACTTQKVYEHVADMYGITIHRVERCIRYAITQTFDGNNNEKISDLFKNMQQPFPSNRMFIKTLSKNIQLKYGL